ncbi:CRISPR-associated protein Cas2 [Treponema parvum]|uniref:CRISPR-associated protein Cas2 n=1 Tax=Treponema parvum TaxID=138851 RepID=A0A975F0X0_9SPIR|nr:CRISPR-associated protein Cas2 [Treponema parvum]QTQ12039.1 CRISPR-associated protein Cas2 [Treponema parvum]QTQ13759.1 CRISPR-associated protein Cas2 [Treponema parvum]QTQ15985.1 CRISPR-associated protein Cas2 [Treponema parvum]
MFVSVVLDPGSADSAKALASVVKQYGFKKIQRACWESTVLDETQFMRLKQDIDRVTDYYDTLRFYQFPLNGMFAVTELNKKKWRRCLIKA